jgi:hypothetical protein
MAGTGSAPTTFGNLTDKVSNITGLEDKYIAVDTDDYDLLQPKAVACFTAADERLKTLADSNDKTNGYINMNTVKTRNEALDNVQNLILQGIINLKNLNWLLLANGKKPGFAKEGGGKNKNRKQKGGAVPDLVNNIAAFQNMGGLLATASPLDNANRVEPAIYNAGSFNAGIFMPLSSGAGLPDSYRLAMDQPLQQTGGKKNNKKNNKNKN